LNQKVFILMGYAERILEMEPKIVIEAKTIKEAKEILSKILGGEWESNIAGHMHFNLEDIKKDKRWKKILRSGCRALGTHTFVLKNDLCKDMSDQPLFELFFDQGETGIHLHLPFIVSLLIKTSTK